ncbi:MarR family transcriptional repressor of emrRAB [Oxalobacteraceae bacterium GrIS 1.11]
MNPVTARGASPHRTAEEAAAPHLELMRMTAPEISARGKAGVGMLMLWLADDITRAVNDSLLEHGLSENKFSVLMQFGLAERGLLEVEALSPSYIADYAGVTRSSVTGMLDWLEQRQLLAREVRAADRRSLTLALTPKGRKLLEDALPKYWQACQEIVAILDEHECAALQAILGKVWRHLKRPG